MTSIENLGKLEYLELYDNLIKEIKAVENLTNLTYLQQLLVVSLIFLTTR